MDLSSYRKLFEFREFKEILEQSDGEFWVSPQRLSLSITQLFAKRLINPENNVKRMLFKLGTGTGKSLLSLTLARQFSEHFHELYKLTQRTDSRNIIILGFTQEVFKKELLKFPELGFASRVEIREMQRLMAIGLNGSRSASAQAKADLRLRISTIRRRFKNRNTGGFIEFYGYKKLFNELFISTLPNDVTSHNVYAKYKAGEFVINEVLLARFSKAFVICDEIHIAYNSQELNNYGLAIQFVLDYYKDSIYCIFLTATIINNNKRELVDIANMLKKPGTKHFKSSDYFGDKKGIEDLQPIFDELSDRVVFLEETNSVDYPTLRYQGGGKFTDEVEKKCGKFIRFTECGYSPLQLNTIILAGLGSATGFNTNIINDLVVPNPEFTAEEIALWNPEHERHSERRADVTGMFEPDKIEKALKSADPDWLNEIGIEIEDSRDTYKLKGRWLHRDNLANYCPKGAKLIDTIVELDKADSQYKALIYHPMVRVPGIDIYAEMMYQNGYTPLGTNPSRYAISADKYVMQKDWKEGVFRPSRYVALSIDVSSSQQSRIIDEFNAESNKFGSSIKFFIGSQKVRQSIDFKDTTKEFIMAKPTNIPEYIQIVGRTVRNKSVNRLPIEKRFVDLYTFISGKVEENAYMRKILEFKEIQLIERNINANAINNFIYGRKTFKSSNPIGALSFPIELEKSEINYDSYVTRGFHKVVLFTYKDLIKVAFISKPVWKKEELWQFILSKSSFSDHPFHRDLFEYALSDIVFKKNKELSLGNQNIFNFDNNVIDANYVSRKSYGQVEKAIVEIKNDFYILCPKTSNFVSLHRNCFLHVNEPKRYDVVEVKGKKYNDRVKIYLKIFNDAEDKLSIKYDFISILTGPDHDFIRRRHIEGVEPLPPLWVEAYEELNLMDKKSYINKEGQWIWDQGWKVIAKNRHAYDELAKWYGLLRDGKFTILQNVLESNDGRKKQKGLDCKSHSKAEIKEIMEEYGLEPVKGVSRNCSIIYNHLIAMEINTRQNGGDKFLFTFDEDI